MRYRKRILFFSICLLVGILSGCGKDDALSSDGTFEEKGSSEEIVVLRGVIIGEEAKNMADVYERLDELTMRDLGCIVRFDFISWGEEKIKLKMALASGEYDLLPAGSFSDYQTVAQKNAYANLNELLYLVPDLVAHYQDAGEDALEQCEINGGLYGIPQYGTAGIYGGYSEGFLYREDLRREWKLQTVTDLATMEAYLYRAKADERYAQQPLITDNRIWRSLWLMLSKGRYLEVVSSIDDIPYLVVDAGNPSEVLNRFETPEMQELIAYAAKWYKDGIIDAQILGASDNESERARNLLASDKKPCETNIPIWVVSPKFIPVIYESHPEWEFQFFPYNRNDEQFFITNMSENTVIAITQKSSHKEQAIRLLEKLHTDEEYYLLMTAGIEGVNYYMENGVLSQEKIAGEYRFSGVTGLTDFHYHYDSASVSPKWQEVIDALETEGKNILESNDLQVAPVIGFAIDWTGMEDIRMQLDEIYSSYIFPLLCGVGEGTQEELERVNSMLYDAGLQEILENVSDQLENFFN